MHSWHGRQGDPGNVILQGGKWDTGDMQLHPEGLWPHV